jgi:DNA-binding LytR/AlgR family response regulator
MHTCFFVRTDGKYIRINCSDVICIEGCKNYVRIVTEKKSYLVLATMKRMEMLLPSESFVRIHKSYIIPIERLTEFNSEVAYLGNKFFPVGKQYRGFLEKAVHLITLDDLREPTAPSHLVPAKMLVGFGARVA